MFVCLCNVVCSNKSPAMITTAYQQAKMSALDLDVSYKRMRQNAKNPHSAPFRKANDRVNTNDPISNFKTFVHGKKPTDDYVYIKLDESSRSLVSDNLEELEVNYYKHTFAASSHDISEARGNRMLCYFNLDKLGLDKVTTSDTNCWKMVTVTSDTPMSTAKTTKSTPPSKPASPAGKPRKKLSKKARKKRKKALKKKKAKEAAEAKEATAKPLAEIKQVTPQRSSSMFRYDH